MKKWTFSMQSLLDLRMRKEDQATLEFTAASRKFAAAQERIADIQKKLDAAAEYRMLGETLQAGEHLKHGSYWILLQKEMSDAVVAKEAAAANVERAGKALLAAQREKKAVEKLRDKEWVDFAANQQRLEQAEADELGTVRFINQIK